MACAVYMYVLYIDRADLESDNELNLHYELLFTDNALCFQKCRRLFVVVVLKCRDMIDVPGMRL